MVISLSGRKTTQDDSASFPNGHPAPERDETSFEIRTGKPACLMIHGFTGTPTALRELGNLLAGEGISVYALLLPGHGTTPEDLSRTGWEEWTATVQKKAELLAQLHRPLFLLGHSMGGSLALWLAAKGMGDGAVTLSAPYRLRRIHLLLIPLLRHVTFCWEKTNHSGGNRKKEAGYSCYPLQAVMELAALLRNLRSMLHRITIPLLIFHGRGDQRIPSKNGRKIYQKVRSTDKKLILLDDDTHMIMCGSEKERIASEISRFFRQRMNP